jgi:hypothetical protein
MSCYSALCGIRHGYATLAAVFSSPGTPAEISMEEVSPDKNQGFSRSCLPIRVWYSAPVWHENQKWEILCRMNSVAPHTKTLVFLRFSHFFVANSYAEWVCVGAAAYAFEGGLTS